tara:strand:+ start:581 stop:808 length:228 start_codon:yes stop_codon:yes gene_type:complete
MELFTALLIYYPLQGNDVVSEIWFESYAKCERVLRSEALEIIYDSSRDIHITCESSDVVSNTLRPRARPKDFGNG